MRSKRGGDKKSVLWVGGSGPGGGVPDTGSHPTLWTEIGPEALGRVEELKPLLVVVDAQRMTRVVRSFLKELDALREQLGFFVYLLRNRPPSSKEALIDGYLMRDASLGHQLQAAIAALRAAEKMRQQRDRHQKRLLHLRRKVRRLSHMVVRDDLTSLYNLRFFNRTLDSEHSRATRFGRTYSLIFIDLDGLREVNTHHGHLMGAQVLKRVGAYINGHVRRIDIPARVGGDEFVIICPETSKVSTRILAERLREGIEAHCSTGNSHPVTASLGIASFPEDGDLPEKILERADRALYEAKARGRNRVCCWGEFPADLGRHKRGSVQTTQTPVESEPEQLPRPELEVDPTRK